MPITAAIVQPGNVGKGPLPDGPMGEETWELTHDGASTSIAITARRLRAVNYAYGDEATITVSGKVATLTFAAARANGLKQYVKLVGRGR